MENKRIKEDFPTNKNAPFVKHLDYGFLSEN